MLLKSENDCLISSVYDKRDNFSFEIVNYPYIDSCIPKRCALGVYISQLIRYARISSKFEDFKSKSVSLVNKLRNQGYYLSDLRRLTLKFYRDRRELIHKYRVSNANIFLKEISQDF